MNRALRLLKRLEIARWATEIAGVGLVAGAGWMVAQPLGLLVAGLYLMLVAYKERTGGN